jgi:hypothetical protein
MRLLLLEYVGHLGERDAWGIFFPSFVHPPATTTSCFVGRRLTEIMATLLHYEYTRRVLSADKQLGNVVSHTCDQVLIPH